MNVRIIIAAALLTAWQSPSGHHTGSADRKPIRLITLDPGHFHADLVRKSMYADMDSTVYVYAPEGPDVQSHLQIIDAPQPQADTLTAGVFPPRPTLLKGATRDLAGLDIRLQTLRPNATFTPLETADHLLIVKEGHITLEPADKTIGPGGVGLFSASDKLIVHNTGTTGASFYVFDFQSREGANPDRSRQTSPFIRDWSELVMKKTDKGESRAIFSQPTTWLKNINMHATTLDPGQISHPQHMHRAEEILLLRSGNVRMHIADGYRPARGGDLVFLPSGVPHDLENGSTGRTEYFALQWEP